MTKQVRHFGVGIKFKKQTAEYAGRKLPEDFLSTNATRRDSYLKEFAEITRQLHVFCSAFKLGGNARGLFLRQRYGCAPVRPLPIRRLPIRLTDHRLSRLRTRDWRRDHTIRVAPEVIIIINNS